MSDRAAGDSSQAIQNAGDRARSPAGSRRRVSWKVMLRRLILYVLLAYVLWCGALYFVQERLIFPGTYLRRDGDSRPRPDTAEVLWHDVGGGKRVEAWLILGKGVSPRRPGPLLVFAHGNAELIDDWPEVLTAYTDAGISLLLVEYRGYGRSGGSPSESGIVADHVAVLDRVLQRTDVDRERMVYHGRSIGGGVVAQLASARPPRGLILESSFTSLSAMAVRYAAPQALVRHPFRTDRVLAALDVPVLLFHGRADATIPVEHARALTRIAKRARLIEFDGGHDDQPPAILEHSESIFAWLGEIGILR